MPPNLAIVMTNLSDVCTTANSRISGWFRIVVVATAVAAMTALRADDGEYPYSFGHDLVLAMLGVIALRLGSLACDWISAGFPRPQQQTLGRRARTVAVGLCVFGCAYLAVALFRYQIVAVDHSNAKGRSAQVMILDRLTGKVTPVTREVEAPQHRQL
jgi:hypothetical protein